MSQGFKHSIKVPRLYKITSTIVKQVTEDGESLKQLIYNKKHPNIKGVYALAATTLQHASELNEIVRKTQLLFKEPRLDPWLARVLITELIWGKQSLKNDAKPIQTIISYENQIREEFGNINKISTDSPIVFTKAGKPRYVRINTLLMTVDEAINGFNNEGYTILPRSHNYEDFLTNLRQLDQYTYIQDFHIPELFAFAPGTQFHDHPEYHSGAIVLQDKASCLPAHLLKPKIGTVILDMCAAPGMKTSHLAAKIQNNGTIYSVEMNLRRYSVLCDLVKSTNAYCVKTINADAMTLNPGTCPYVEYILVDPSCSGSGMERLNYDTAEGKCAPSRLKSLQSFQVLLLRHALLTFTMAKRVIYSTCSIYPEENEMVVDEILSNVGDAYRLVPIKSLLNNQWLNYSSNDFKCRDNCLYAKPDVDMCNGFFVAVFERNPDISLPEYKRHNGENLKKGNDEDTNIQKDVSNDHNGNSELGKKRRKKKEGKSIEKSTSGKSDNGSELNVDLESVADVLPKKKKKKSVEKSTESTETVSDSIEIIDISECEESRKKKRKTSGEKSTDGTEKNPDLVEMCDISVCGESPQKKKKKSEEKLTEDTEKDPDSVEIVNISVCEESRKKKKNKKEKSQNNVSSNTAENSFDHSHDMLKKKKKKKKVKEET